LNESKRQDGRQEELFVLHPGQSESEIVERRIPPEEPRETLFHRIVVQCTKLE
jgi:hypothetical protein